MEYDKTPIPYTPHLNPQNETIYLSPGEWMKIKKDEEFFYAERKGIDSIAFVLFSNNLTDTKRIGLINEFKNPIGKSIISAFGGSIDDEKFHADLRTLVKVEVLEESGFDVELDQIVFYGRCLVSSMMNEYCYLFGVTVNKEIQGERTTTNPLELRNEVVWIEIPETPSLEDWKAFMIITKRMISANAKLTVRPIK